MTRTDHQDAQGREIATSKNVNPSPWKGEGQGRGSSSSSRDDDYYYCCLAAPAAFAVFHAVMPPSV